ncbi:hypothetical protein CSKR_200684, partial [Clonorchis sinensis]
ALLLGDIKCRIQEPSSRSLEEFSKMYMHFDCHYRANATQLPLSCGPVTSTREAVRIGRLAEPPPRAADWVAWTSVFVS